MGLPIMIQKRLMERGEIKIYLGQSYNWQELQEKRKENQELHNIEHVQTEQVREPQAGAPGETKQVTLCWVSPT